MTNSHGSTVSSQHTSNNDILSIDVGGTKTAISLVKKDEDSSDHRDQLISTLPEKGINDWADRAVRALSHHKFSFIGICVPSPVYNGLLLNPSNLVHESWNNADIAQVLRDKGIECPVYVANDGDCGGLYAHMLHFGQLAKERTSCYRAMGTGLGGVDIEYGKIKRGRQGITSEPGHVHTQHRDLLPEFLLQNWDERPQNDRTKLEELACLEGLKILLPHFANNLPDHKLSKLFIKQDAVKAALQVRNLAAGKDSEALSLLEFQLRMIGRHLANCDKVDRRDAYILGGGLLDKKFTPPELVNWALTVIKAQYVEEFHPASSGMAEIVITTAGDHAQILGAAINAKNMHANI